MSKLSFYRRPVKLVLYMLLLLVITTAALVFTLQYLLDGYVMDYSMDSAAYVGTVYSRRQEHPMLRALPEEVVEGLRSSTLVSELFVRRTHSGRADGLEHVQDGFGVTETLEKRLFVDGFVSDEPMLSPTGIGVLEYVTVRIRRVWGGSWDRDEVILCINRGWEADAPQLRPGDHVFSIGRYNCDSEGNVIGVYLVDPQIQETDFEASTESDIWRHGLLALPRNLTDGEADVLIQSHLEEHGLQSSLSATDSLRDVFTVHEVEDMSMLLSVADETMFMTGGRELRSGDRGERVCVISRACAEKNGLDVGDRISLSLSDGCYTSREEIAFYDGLESGYPFETDPLLPYQDCGEYEIVGIFHQIGRKVGGLDLFHFSWNDIFIPAGTTDGFGAEVVPRPYNLSFRVMGPDLEAFMDAFEVPLNQQGYTMNIVDTGWAELSGSFYAMEDRRSLMLGCAILCYLVAVLAFDHLLYRHFRYEYALRRLLGAYPREAGEVYVLGYLSTAVPVGILAVAASYGAYVWWLEPQVLPALPVHTPDGWRCLALLAGWTLLELAAMLAVLMGAVSWTRKRSLLRLLK